jgi:hypothetical protein
VFGVNHYAVKFRVLGEIGVNVGAEAGKVFLAQRRGGPQQQNTVG